MDSEPKIRGKSGEVEGRVMDKRQKARVVRCQTKRNRQWANVVRQVARPLTIPLLAACSLFLHRLEGEQVRSGGAGVDGSGGGHSGQKYELGPTGALTGR